jgi:hypothetical protein
VNVAKNATTLKKTAERRWPFRKWPNITAHSAKHQAISATFCRFPERL